MPPPICWLQLAEEERVLTARLHEASSGLEQAKTQRKSAEEAIATAEARLEDSEKRLATLSTCDATEPFGRDGLAAELAAAETELGQLETDIETARHRMVCLKFHAELEARSKTPANVSLHSRETRFRRIVESELGQRRAFCDEVAIGVPYSFEDRAMREQNYQAERSRLSSLKSIGAALRRRHDEAKSALAWHDIAVREARQCNELKSASTRDQVLAEVEANRTSLAGLRTVLENRASALTAATQGVNHARTALTALSQRRAAACRDLAEAAERVDTGPQAPGQFADQYCDK